MIVGRYIRFKPLGGGLEFGHFSRLRPMHFYMVSDIANPIVHVPSPQSAHRLRPGVSEVHEQLRVRAFNNGNNGPAKSACMVTMVTVNNGPAKSACMVTMGQLGVRAF